MSVTQNKSCLAPPQRSSKAGVACNIITETSVNDGNEKFGLKETEKEKQKEIKIKIIYLDNFRTGRKVCKAQRYAFIGDMEV